jgi:hypothetical protein
MQGIRRIFPFSLFAYRFSLIQSAALAVAVLIGSSVPIGR